MADALTPVPNLSVEIPLAVYQELRWDAVQWRRLTASPHCEAIIAEHAEWVERRRLRESSQDMSMAHSPRLNATTYAELARRRAEVIIPEWAKSGNAMLARRRGEAA